jgi:hypothetical protein
METNKIKQLIESLNELMADSTTKEINIGFNVDKNQLLKIALEFNTRINAPTDYVADYYTIIKAGKISLIFSYKPEFRKEIINPINVEQFNSELQ